MKIPDRWLNYKNSGRIKGTRFVAIKVPLKEFFSPLVFRQSHADAEADFLEDLISAFGRSSMGYSKDIPPSKSFTPRLLRKQYPEIKLIIDLTFTTKYYNGITEFEQNGIKYVKIMCRGRKIPHEGNFKKFAKEVDEFIKETPKDYLIGIHCTHGVNRTGYLIVRYMIERMGYSPQKALNVFLKSRGHAIERTLYIEDLLKRKMINNY